MKKIYKRIYTTIAEALPAALKTSWWLTKIMLPITIGVAILNYLGVIEWISDQIAPMFSVMGLPGKAGLVLVSSMLSNLYSAIAVMATLGFDLRSITILSVMCLIAHNLILETMVQQKSGAKASFIVPLRILASLLMGFIMNWVLPEQMTGYLMFDSSPEVPQSLSELFINWFTTTIPLTIKMVSVVITLNLLQSLLREFGVVDLLIYPLRPFMKLFGLDCSTSFLWIIANMIGLAYGGAVLINEAQKNNVTHKDAVLFNTHIALSHSLLEDTFIFIAIGVGAGWLILPRMCLAIIAVWIQRFIIDRKKSYNICAPGLDM